MVNMLARNNWGNRVGLLLVDGAVALELGSFLFQTGFDRLGIAMLMMTLLDGDDVMVVFFREDLAVLDGLDGGVVVVLVHLTVDGSGGLLVTFLNNVFVHNRRGNLFVNGCVVVTSLVPISSMSVEAH